MPKNAGMKAIRFRGFTLFLDGDTKTARIACDGTETTPADRGKAIAMICTHVGTITANEFDAVYDYVCEDTKTR